jgi:hypothetical protein
MNTYFKSNKRKKCIWTIVAAFSITLFAGSAVAKQSAASYLPAIISLVLQDEEKLPASVVAYAWANNPSAADYIPDTSRSYNASGGPVNARRTSAGIYTIYFDGADFNSSSINFQITPTTSGSEECALRGFSSNAVLVECFDSNGSHVDSAYNVVAIQTGVGSQARYKAYAAFFDLHNPESYSAPTQFAYATVGDRPSVERVFTGKYLVKFATGLLTNSNIQISTLLSDSHCSAGSWNSSSVSVLCFTPNGSAVDSIFSIAIARADSSIDSDSIETVGFAYADKKDTDFYNPSEEYSFNLADDNIDILRSLAGIYGVIFSKLESFGEPDTHVGIPMVTTLGSKDTCVASSITREGVFVNCYDTNRNLVDAAYMVQYIRRKSID